MPPRPRERPATDRAMLRRHERPQPLRPGWPARVRCRRRPTGRHRPGRMDPAEVLSMRRGHQPLGPTFAKDGTSSVTSQTPERSSSHLWDDQSRPPTPCRVAGSHEQTRLLGAIRCPVSILAKFLTESPEEVTETPSKHLCSPQRPQPGGTRFSLTRPSTASPILSGCAAANWRSHQLPAPSRSCAAGSSTSRGNSSPGSGRSRCAERCRRYSNLPSAARAPRGLEP